MDFIALSDIFVDTRIKSAIFSASFSNSHSYWSRDQLRRRINVAVALTCQIHVSVVAFPRRGMNTCFSALPPPPSSYIFHVVFPRDFHVLVSVGFEWNRERRRHCGVSGRRERETKNIEGGKKRRDRRELNRRRSSSLIGVRRRDQRSGMKSRLPSSSSTDPLLRDRLRASLYRIFDWRHAHKKGLKLKKRERKKNWNVLLYYIFFTEFEFREFPSLKN